MRVPAWLIVDGADASAEAVLGLAARVEARRPTRPRATRCASSPRGSRRCRRDPCSSWPYGAILPWAQSRSMWHAWGSQMPAALAEASVVLGDPRSAEPAITDAAVFTPTLLTAGGPDNGWFPSPTDRVQIAYGADSRVQSLLAVADATGSARLRGAGRHAGRMVLRREPRRRAHVRPGDRHHLRRSPAGRHDQPQQRRREHDPRAADDDRARRATGTGRARLVDHHDRRAGRSRASSRPRRPPKPTVPSARRSRGRASPAGRAAP